MRPPLSPGPSNRTSKPSPPQPNITEHSIGGALDQTLDFGVMKMCQGVAFAFGERAHTIPVNKRWLLLDNRQWCLIEETPYKLLQPLLAQLPASSGHAGLQNSPDSVIHRVASVHLLPERKPASATTSPLQVASLSPENRGVALDYTIVEPLSNYRFRAGTTYYVPCPVLVFDETVIEGTAVIKYTNDPASSVGLFLSGTLKCETSPYRMAVFTSMNDDHVGQLIAGSTGSPTSTNGATFLGWGSGAFKYLRFSYGNAGINGGSYADTSGGVWHCQFVNCVNPISTWGGDINLHNVLFSGCDTAVMDLSGTLYGEHATADNVGTFWQNWNGDAAMLTNSILTAVTNLGDNVTLDHCATNSSSAGFFQTVGAASYYLADSTTNRDSGTTNINSTLLQDLKQMTTYPPTVLTNSITSITTLSPQVERDTNAPDLGYHYAPLDYCFNHVSLTNTMLLTNGVALGTYGCSGNFGLAVSGTAARLVSEGSPTSLNWIVRYNTVQEQSTANWISTAAGSSISIAGTGAGSQFRFTAWSSAGGVGTHLDTSGSLATNFLRDCEFFGGLVTFDDSFANVTNCLFQGEYVSLDDRGEDEQYYFYNSLFLGGTFYYRIRANNPFALAYDNLFDETTVSQGDHGADFDGSDYNGYVTNKTRLKPHGTHDVILTNTPVFQVGPLGSTYYPTNDGMLNNLFDKGSRRSGDAGLFNYTTTAPPLDKDDGTKVDIGFHYAAVDAGGNPIDADGDGLPDYLEESHGISNWRIPDTDGDGLLDGWEYYHGLNPQVSNAGGVIWWANATGAVGSLPGITNVIGLAAGANHGLVLQEGGTVLAWGDNIYNQTNVAAAATNVVAIAAGDNHNLALKSDTTVVAWGRNNWSQTNVPSGLSNVIAVAAGGDQSLALLSNGTITNWGTNFGTIPATATNVIAIAAGTNFCLALRSNGTVVAWGNTSNGQTNVPASATNVVAIAAGGDHALALRANGSVVAWGNNSSGQTNVPSCLTNVMAIAAGYTHSIALSNNATLVEWGNAAYIQTSLAPVSRVKLTAAGGNQSLVSLFSPTVQYQVDVTKDLLVIYNVGTTNNFGLTNSAFVKDYYLANRPLVSGANRLAIDCTNAELITPLTFTNQILGPLGQWLANNPTKHPLYIILFPDIPSTVCESLDCFAYPGSSMSYRLSTNVGGIQPFITSINVGLFDTTNDCVHYIDKLAAIGVPVSSNGPVLSASAGAYANTNYVVDDVHDIYCGEPWVAAATNGLIAAGVSPSAIQYLAGCEAVGSPLPHLTNAVNVAGYISWGFHSSLGSYYATNRTIRWSGNSGWWIIRTVESFNGQRAGDGGNFLMWFSSNAFGGTNYSNTPIGGPTYVAEPLATATDNAILFGLWASGKNLERQKPTDATLFTGCR